MRTSRVSTSLLVLLGALLVGLGCRTAAIAAPAMPTHLTLRVPSRLLSEMRVVNVYVPPGYDGKSERRYPVLYMPDGGEKEDFPHLAITLDALIRDEEIPAMLLVGIENTERHRDLTGPTEIATDREIAAVVGGSASFRDFIERELVPLIGTFYKVNEQRSIIGESLAGLFVVESLFEKPRLFSTHIAIDPSLWWNAEQWWREAGARLKSNPGLQARLLLSSAGDSGSSAAHLADALCRNALPGLQWTYAAHPLMRHADIFRSLEKDLLRQAFSGDPLPATDCGDSSARDG